MTNPNDIFHGNLNFTAAKHAAREIAISLLGRIDDEKIIDYILQNFFRGIDGPEMYDNAAYDALDAAKARA